jgi:epoxyqueuosine reductase
LIRDELAVLNLQELAKNLGFVVLGIARAREVPDFDHFCEWLDSGYSGSMNYLSGRREAYRHPDHVLEGCRSILMLAMPYAKHPRTHLSKGNIAERRSDSPMPALAAKPTGTIAAYAGGPRDYHGVIRDRQQVMVDALSRMFPGSQSRGVVDTAPLLERCFGRLAGLGWVGKNTLLLNKELGSYFFLAAILTSVELPSASASQTAHCGTCQACLDACPTQAFPAPYVLDATRCISYWTIEHKGSIPESRRRGISDWLFGCDACQTVCPWNRKPDVEIDRELAHERWTEKGDCTYWLSLDEADFRRDYRHTAFWRTRLVGMRRNAMIVAANTGRHDAVDAIRSFLTCGDEVLEETARWSLQQLQAHPQ